MFLYISTSYIYLVCIFTWIKSLFPETLNFWVEIFKYNLYECTTLEKNALVPLLPQFFFFGWISSLYVLLLLCLFSRGMGIRYLLSTFHFSVSTSWSVLKLRVNFTLGPNLLILWQFRPHSIFIHPSVTHLSFISKIHW